MQRTNKKQQIYNHSKSLAQIEAQGAKLCPILQQTSMRTREIAIHMNSILLLGLFPSKFAFRIPRKWP